MEKFGEIISYADEVVLLVADENWQKVNDNIGNDMGETIIWLNTRNLKLNVNKTNVVQFSLKK